MTSNDDLNSGMVAANPGPFVVSHPCTVCHGHGDIKGRPVSRAVEPVWSGSSTARRRT